MRPYSFRRLFGAGPVATAAAIVANLLYYSATRAFGEKYLLPLGLEGVIGIFAILSVVIIFLLRQPEPVEVLPPAAPALVVPVTEPVPETAENLENTRYQ